ncbi:MAG TPA: protein-methionine-sulfoxide reductase catalytic subunit MsrP [Verrucomicrobiae bacterium]|nr:protein-methionine-sulfoxide reductase catalytic subunit MsrP [Verrucomicrobiae bacterium]
MPSEPKEDLTYVDVTPKHVYQNRRNFLVGLLVTGTAVAGWKKYAYLLNGPATGSVPVKLNGFKKWPYSTTETVTPENDVTHYNNFYEFGTGKEDPAQNARDFVTTPWSVTVDGEVEKPRKFTMEEIMQLAPLEERIYRHRCVEAWSMVVPWIGYPFSVIANLVQPTDKARFVAFQTYYDPRQMPLGSQAGIELPYVEGLRMDEAMNPLTLLTVGMYGETLPNQDGAPVRMVIPWKYGFKSIKSLVRIRFVKNQPPTTWNLENSQEYGFYSNVNPHVDHPRWSQAKERRLGEFFRRPTLMFNGYGDQVASMYTGMDLKKYF